MIDAYPLYKQLRDEEPVHYLEDMNLHVVTRYDLLRDVIKRTDDFSSKYDQFMGGAQMEMFNTLSDQQKAEALKIAQGMIDIPPTMLTLDEPEHTKYRSLVSKLFTGGQVKKSEADVRAVIEENILEMKDRGKVDFMEVFAFPVPLEIISDRLGIPRDTKSREFFYEAATSAASALKMAPVPPEQILGRMQTAVDLQKFLIELVEACRRAPQDNMISILCRGLPYSVGPPTPRVSFKRKFRFWCS